MRTVILEDEKLSAEHLATLLRKADPTVSVLAVYDTVKKGIEAFRAGLEADLLMADIHLADGLSFDIFSEVHPDIPVIFTTAYDEYAVQAFKLNSVDYLLKPVALEELRAALDKHRRLNTKRETFSFTRVAELYRELGARGKNRFLVKTGDTIISVKTTDVHHFVAEDGICFLVNNSGKRYPVDYTLDQLESLINPGDFFRINRKILLSINAVGKVSTYFNSRLKIIADGIEGESCIVSRERVAEFKRWLDQ